MIKNRLRAAWDQNRVAIGMYSGTIASPTIVEIIGFSGYDSAYFDMEHTGLDLGAIQTLVLAAERVGVCPIVRIPSLDAPLCTRLLDMGVQGIYVPHVSTAADAEAAVSACRYPPYGHRGLMPSCRAAEYGRVPLKQHIEESNTEIIVAIMIEDQKGVDEIDAIVAVEGLDIVAVGPADLAQELGVGDTPDHPKLGAAIERIADAVRRNGKVKLAIPMTAIYPRTAVELRDMGVAFMNLAPIPENRLRRALTSEVEALRKALG
jgi:4-hydroxy-2-oxoheptanedioate aldolase